MKLESIKNKKDYDSAMEIEEKCLGGNKGENCCLFGFLYKKLFDFKNYISCKCDDDKIRKMREYRLDKVLDIRKFEIELYWKRATYFWTIIAVTFTGYGIALGAMKDASEITNNNILHFQFIILSLGIIFSFSWYLVNKGSKFWQENWESHLDLLEDEVMGPIYKVTKKYTPWWNIFCPSKPGSFSVSKVNLLLSFYVFLFWIGLMIIFICSNYTFSCGYSGIDWLITIVSGFILIFLCHTTFSSMSQNKTSKVDFVRRNIE